MKMLLEAGADVYVKTEKGSTLLHLAAGHGDAGACKLLIEHGIDIDAANGFKPGAAPSRL